MTMLITLLLLAGELDPAKVSYNIDYKAGTPSHPAVPADSLLVVREGQTLVLEWNAVTSASNDSSQSWDTSPDWSRTEAMTRFKPPAGGQSVAFDQILALPQGFWKFRVWSFYNYPTGEKRSKTPSREIGILIVPPDPEHPDRPVSFKIRLQ